MSGCKRGKTTLYSVLCTLYSVLCRQFQWHFPFPFLKNILAITWDVFIAIPDAEWSCGRSSDSS